MESAIPLLLFLGFLFGSALLILIFGFKDLESRFQWDDAESDAKEPAPVRAPVREVPRFFSRLGSSNESPLPSTAWAAAASPWESLEQHLRHEHDVAAAFVEAPSMESMLWESPPETDAYAQQVEKYLQSEYRKVAQIINRPGTDALYPRTKHLQVVPRQPAPRASRPLSWGPAAPWGEERR